MRNKVALVTGAASGIGATIAQRLSEQGVDVAAVDRDKSRLRETVEKLGTGGRRVEAFPADVSDCSDAESVVDWVERRVGPVEYLVNAAGVLRLGELREFDIGDWDTTFSVNTRGVFLMSQATVERMVKHGHGAIVTVASNSAGTPRMHMGAYAASKAATTMFMKCLGLEVTRYGIRCNIVAPGSTETPMLTGMWRSDDDAGPDETIEGDLDAYRLGIPLGKLAQPSDIADAVVFLLSDQASHITLQTLTVDGGATLGV